MLLFTDDSSLNFALSRPPDFERERGVKKETKKATIFHTKEYVVTVSGGRRGDLLDGDRAARNRFEKEMALPLTFSQKGFSLSTKPALSVNIESVWQEPHQKRAPKECGLFTANVKVILAEGKNHQVRRICYRSGLKVKGLHRRSIAGILNDKKVPRPGDVRWLSDVDIRELRSGLGL